MIEVSPSCLTVSSTLLSSPLTGSDEIPLFSLTARCFPDDRSSNRRHDDGDAFVVFTHDEHDVKINVWLTSAG